MIVPIALHQFLNQLVFLAVGKSAFSLTVTWAEIGLVLATAVILEHAFILLAKRKIDRFSFSAISSGFNLAFMLGVTHFGVYAAALLAGLGQKHFFKRWTGRHFFNPSNFGLVAAFLLFPQYTYGTFLDRGGNSWFAATIVILGSLLLFRIHLLFVPYVFLAASVVFTYLFHTHSWPAIWLQLNSVGFLLFAFFMITDPRALPGSRRFMIFHACLTALLVAVIPLLLGPKEVNLFLALVLSSLLIPFWRYIEESAPRHWMTPALGISFAALFLTALMVYHSPYNGMRNTLRSFSNLPAQLIGNAVTSATVAPDNYSRFVTPPTPNKLWDARDPELYLQQWAEPRVIRRKLERQPRRAQRFAERAGALPVTTHATDPRDFGFSTLFYAGLAAGDINQDGHLDLVTTKVLEPLRVLINNGDGEFIDATRTVFPAGVPPFVESAVLADFNNDTQLDLLVLFSQYYTRQPATLFLFDASSRQYRKSFTFPGKHSSGGVGLVDINQDGMLDFYVSYGINWYENCYDTKDHGAQDEFYVSGGGDWRESLGDYFDGPLPREAFAGMTAAFADINGDGLTEFLLGNDFGDPSLIYSYTGKGFELKPPEYIENNTLESMSYFPADFNNDGVFELWENGISHKQTVGRRSQKKVFSRQHRSLQHRELERLEKTTDWQDADCSGYKDKLVASLCRDIALHNMAERTNAPTFCEQITSLSLRACCNSKTTRIAKSAPGPSNMTYDVELYSKQLNENVLLKYNKSQDRFENVLKGNLDAEYTDWTWSAFPFDVDNDGLIDLYIGNGAISESHDENRLLINQSKADKFYLKESGTAWGVNYEDETRAVIIADFDGDGDGDLVLNNFLTAPKYLENLSGGGSVILDLRAKTSNYYAVGAVVRLHTARSILTRAVSVGGIWNTSQPLPLHFGIPAGEEIVKVEVTWPTGKTSSYQNIEPGYKYVIYE